MADLLRDLVYSGPRAPQNGTIGAMLRPDAMPPSVMHGSYLTTLDPLREAAFLSWVKSNGVPFDPSDGADYDMRGFWAALQAGDPRATAAVNANDGQMHYPDVWKTPNHESFSGESKFATADAPRWNDDDQLVDRAGRVVFDERRRALLRDLLDR